MCRRTGRWDPFSSDFVEKCIPYLRPKSLSRMSSRSPEDEVNIEIDEILFDQKGFPFTRSALLRWLQEIHSDENLEFWMEAQKFREHALGQRDTITVGGVKREVEAFPVGLVSTASQEKIVTLSNDQDFQPLISSKGEWAKQIIRDYIGPDAAKVQVNLSDIMAREYLLHLNSEEIPDFEPAQTEARNMIRNGDGYLKFVKIQHTVNIDEYEANSRVFIGTLWFLFAWLVGLVLRYAVPSIPSWGVGLIVFPEFIMAFTYLLSGAAKTCPERAVKGTMMMHGYAHEESRRRSKGEAFLRTKVCSLPVKDPVAKAKLRNRGIMIIMYLVALAFLFSVVIAVLPSLP